MNIPASDTAQRTEHAPRRIVVLGDSCSGKSTLAERLARHLDAPYVELDAVHWQPNWTSLPDDQFRAHLDAIAEGERWVVAGNYRRIAEPTLWPHADLIVWLDLPLTLVLPRMVRRTWRRWRTHELLWGTNYEDPWQHFRLWETKKNLFSYRVTTSRARRAEFAALMDATQRDGRRFVRLCSPREIEAFASAFEASVEASSN
ncbi:MAG: hypothetical protein WCL53_06885 [Chloroflexota bacterium]